MKDWTPEEIKVFRRKLGLKQTEFGETVGVTGNYIFLLERGDKIPGKTLKRLFDCLEREIIRQEKENENGRENHGKTDKGDIQEG